MTLRPQRRHPPAARAAATLAQAAALAAAVLCTPPAAARAAEWTLEHTLAVVRERDPGVRAAQATGDAGRAQAAQTWAMLAPHVSVSSGFTRSDDPALLFSQKLWQGRFTPADFAVDRLNQPAPQSALQWGLAVDQPLWNGGRELTVPGLAGRYRRAATGMEQAAVADRLLGAVEAFVGAVRAREELRSAELALGAADAMRAAASERFRMGQVSELDTLRAAARQQQARVRSLGARRGLAVAIDRVGRLVQESITPDELVAPEALDAAPDRATTARGELAAAREGAAALATESRTAALRLLPSLNSRFALTQYRPWDTGTFERRWMVALAAELPIFDGAQRVNEWRAARARATAATRASAGARARPRRGARRRARRGRGHAREPRRRARRACRRRRGAAARRTALPRRPPPAHRTARRRCRGRGCPRRGDRSLDRGGARALPTPPRPGRPAMTTNPFPRAAAIALLAGLAAGCGHSGRESAAPATGPAVTVTVMRASAGAGETLVLPARVTAREEITLTARLAARLTALPLREGDHFRSGQTLATFDAPETRAALEGARAGLAAATVARDLARRQEQRMDSLYAARVAALRELEGAQAERRAAEAGWAQARAQVDQMQSGVTLEAPFDGVIVRRHADVGTTVGPGQPVLDLRSLGVGEIAAAVPESELGRLANPRAEVQVGDGAWQPATLSRVDGMTDFATRSRIARFRPGARIALEAGAFARVRLAALPHAAGRGSDSTPRPLTVPSRALVRRGGLTGVYVVEDGVARLRWLRVGRESAGAIEVLAGLDGREAVILEPTGLADGRPVKVAS